jgi:hypothetical protein
VILAIGRWRRTGQRGAGVDEIDAVEPPHKINYVAPAAALATVENLLCSVDAEPIITSTSRTRTGPLHLAI